MAGGISKTSSQTTSSTESSGEPALPGDPNCPICGGIGFIRQDLPIGHPDFGRLQICSCRSQAVAQANQSRLYRLSNLEAFKNMSFESFKAEGRLGLGEHEVNSLRSALILSQEYAKGLNGWLLLMGEYGTGKTHLAAAVANFVVSMATPVLFLTVPDLLDWLRFSYGSTDQSFEDRFDEIRNIRLLVLDDLGTQSSTPWAQEKLYQILNHRYTNRLATIITTNLRMEDIEGRVRSRLDDPDLVMRVEIKAPDYRSPVRDEGHPALSTLQHHNGRTFSNFSMREREKITSEQRQNLEKVWEAAHDFAQNPQGWLVLMGEYATGKTHLAAAIGNFRHALGESPMFVVVPDLLDHLRATFSPNSSISYDRLFEEVRGASLLMLDDLGTQSATPWAREKLYQIFNYRYNAELPTVITTADQLSDIDPRIRSRMLDGRMCRIFALAVPPYRPGNGGSEPPARRNRTRTAKS